MNLRRVTCVLALVPAVALAQGGPPPPSSGLDLPRAANLVGLSEAEANAALDKLFADARSPKRDCAALINSRTRLVFTRSKVTKDYVKKNVDGYLWLARCAEKQKYYALMADLSDDLLWADKSLHPELMARALLGLNSPKGALKTLEQAEKLSAKDPDIALTFAKVQCRTRDWANCLKSADRTVKLVTKPGSPEGKETLNRAHKYRARALFHTGKLEEATKAAALSERLGGDAADLADLRKAMVPAKTYKAVVEVDALAIAPLGIYHLIGKREDSKGLARFYVDDIGEDRQFRVEAGIEGITSTQTKLETMLKGQSAVIDLTPQLLPSFDPTALHSARTVQLNLKVTALSPKGEQVVYQDSKPIELLPRDFYPRASFIDEEKSQAQGENGYLAAWVTPSHKSVEAFLSEAKKRAPRNTFSGEQAATIPQVKAIFDTLQAKGVSYVMDPEVNMATGYGQRARLPADVLATTNAQCLEGAILYATLLEAIGLQSAIVLVPGHAFVAWRTSPKDVLPPPRPRDAGVVLADAGGADAGAPVDAGAPTSEDGGKPEEELWRTRPGDYQFLETTLTHDAYFNYAANEGLLEFEKYAKARKVTFLSIPELRRQGYTPQPYQ